MEAGEISKRREGVEKIGKAMKNDSEEKDKQMPKWEVALRALFVIVLMAISAYLFFFARDFNDVLRCIGGAVTLFSVPTAVTINLRHERVKVRIDNGNHLSSSQNNGDMCVSKITSSDNNGPTIICDTTNMYSEGPPVSAKIVEQNATEPQIPDKDSLKILSHDKHNHPTGQGQN